MLTIKCYLIIEEEVDIISKLDWNSQSNLSKNLQKIRKEKGLTAQGRLDKSMESLQKSLRAWGIEPNGLEELKAAVVTHLQGPQRDLLLLVSDHCNAGKLKNLTQLL